MSRSDPISVRRLAYLPRAWPVSVGQRGVTLVELVVSIVVIGIGVAGLLLAMTHTTQRSAGPMVLHQAVAIAESYLEEILLLPYDEGAAGGVATDDPPVGPLGPDPGEGGRATFDDVNDYDGLTDMGARSLMDPATVIAGLDEYLIDVRVFNNDSGLGPAGDPVPAGDAQRVEVRVTQPTAAVDITLTGYRTRY